MPGFAAEVSPIGGEYVRVDGPLFVGIVRTGCWNFLFEVLEVQAVTFVVTSKLKMRTY